MTPARLDASTIVALVPDLMDRSKVSAAAAGRITFVSRADDRPTARFGSDARGGRPGPRRRPRPAFGALAPRSRIIGFGRMSTAAA